MNNICSIENRTNPRFLNVTSNIYYNSNITIHTFTKGLTFCMYQLLTKIYITIVDGYKIEQLVCTIIHLNIRLY